MTSYLDPVILARAQFAFPVSFHFIFPAFSIGLASYLMVLEALWLTTGRGVYANLYRYWIKIFAVVFGARKLRALEDENVKLKKLLGEAMLDNAILKDVAAKKW